ncbi:MAG: hypothetical protein KDC67_00770 [Ignavibacteriae bacterium]|nr:hypothetical protein [Ignavibacteriota bacterium]
MSEIAKQTGMLYYDLSRGLFGSIEGKMFASSFDNIKYESNRFAMYDRARKSVGTLTEIKKKGEMAAGLAAQ